MAIVFVGVGSNLNDRQAQIQQALDLLQQDQGMEILRSSSLYETEPVGVQHQSLFLNAVVQLSTEYSPQDLLAVLQSIEKRMGSQRTSRWGPRCIDLDLLLYDNKLIDQPDLIVPHPELADRAFVLVPLVEIAPSVVHPQRGKSMAELLACTGDTKRVWRYRPRGKSEHD